MPQEVSRKDFLKLMVAGASVVALGRFADLANILNGKPVSLNGASRSASNSSEFLPFASAQSAGSWTDGPPVFVIAIHTALLPTGKVVAVAGSGYHTANINGPYEARLLDPSTGDEVVYTFSEDLFCCGQTNLPNGNVLFAGGTKTFDTQNAAGVFQGLSSAYEFDVYTNSFVKVNSMRHGRWYPTTVSLPNGRVLILSGLDEYGARNALVEIYDPSTKSFTILYRPDSNLSYCVGEGINLPGAGSPCYGGKNKGVSPWTSLYPRMHLMPSGQVLICGMDDVMYLINPSTGVWTNIGNTNQSWRDYGSSFLLPLNNTTSERGRVLIAGGSITDASSASNSCQLIDFNAGSSTAPVIRNTASLGTGRRFAVPIILPTGELVVFGGTRGGGLDFEHTPELFNVQNETWTSLPDANVSRSYHTTGLLLPDGRVWIASSNPNRSTWERRTEFFSPWYLFAGTRPTITGRVKPAPYGGTITIPTSNGTGITKVSLLRLGSSTHHYEPNQRLVWLQITGTNSQSISVSAPINSNIAPPGYYMIHIINSSGVPSKGQIVRVPK
jgi:galactose oxidase-like protein